MRKTLPLFLLAGSLFGGAAEPLKDLAEDYIENKAGDLVEEYVPGFVGDKLKEYIRDAVEDKVGDLIHEAERRLKDYNLSMDFEDREPEKALLDGQIDLFFKEYNSAEEGEGKFDPSGSLMAGGGSPAPVLKPASVRLSVPTISSGTADYITGAAKGANGIVMKKALEDIVGGLSYAYIIGLECVSPLTTSAMKQVQTWSNQLNAMSIQSDDLAAAFNPGLLAKSERSAAYLAEHALASKNNIDLIEARNICQDKKKRSELLQKHADKFQKLMGGSYNTAAKVLGLTDFTEERKNLCLTLGGAVAVFDEGGVKTIEIYPPLYRQAIDYLLTGENGKGYAFKRDGVGVETDSPALPATIGERKKIKALLMSIQEKLRQKDADLTQAETELLQKTRLPIGSLITLLSQTRGTGAKLALERFGDLIAQERTLQWTGELAAELLSKAKSFKTVQICGYELETYIQQLESALAGIEEMKAEHRRSLIQEQQAIDSMMQIEKSLKEKEKGL